MADSRQRGETIADAWLKGYQDWIDKNGGNVLEALITSFNRWYEGGGKESLVKVGTRIGETVAGAAAAAFGELIKQTLFPAGAPRVEGQFDPAASLPTVSVPVSPPGRPGAAGDANITINLADIAHAPGFQQRLQTAFEQFWAQFLQAEAATDPGAPRTVQGTGR